MQKQKLELDSAIGSYYLDTISREVMRWQAVSDYFDPISQINDQLAITAGHLRTRLLLSTITSESGSYVKPEEIDKQSLINVAEDLDHSELSDLLAVFMASSLITRLETLKMGQNIEVSDQTVLIKVKESGVKLFKSDEQGNHINNPKILFLGQLISGEMVKLSTSPTVGGELLIRRGRRSSPYVVNGLVSPFDGASRVKLNVFK